MCRCQRSNSPDYTPVQAAIARLKMSTAMKVLLAFSEPFWPPDFFDVVCTGAGLVGRPDTLTARVRTPWP